MAHEFQEYRPWKTQAQFEITSIVISHDMASAKRIADQIHMLAKGELVASGTPEELAAGKSDVALRFIQASGVDLTSARVKRGRAGDVG